MSSQTPRKNRSRRFRSALRRVNARHGKSLRALAEFEPEVTRLLAEDRELLRRLSKS